MKEERIVTTMKERFRGYFPVVVDVETGGLNSKKDALLEIAAVTLKINSDGSLSLNNTYAEHIEPFPGSNIEQDALEINKIDPFHPFRIAKSEKDALNAIFTAIKKEQKLEGCTRSILIGHNAAFDQSFVEAAIKRCQIKRSPFHPFSNLDTVSLGALAYGQTVLARCCKAAGIEFNSEQAHSAKYDTERTAELFCKIINTWQELAGCSFYAFAED